jgi:hypothetical protein
VLAPPILVQLRRVALACNTDRTLARLIPERRPGFALGSEGSHRAHDDGHGISDEQRVYSGTSLLAALEEGPLPIHDAHERWVHVPASPVDVRIIGPLGMRGYVLGPNVHVIDLNSLADPLMPRLLPYETTTGDLLLPPGDPDGIMKRRDERTRSPIPPLRPTTKKCASRTGLHMCKARRSWMRTFATTLVRGTVSGKVFHRPCQTASRMITHHHMLVHECTFPPDIEL